MKYFLMTGLIAGSVYVLFACKVRNLENDVTLSATHKPSTDVQVIAAQLYKNICFRYSGGPENCSGYYVIKPHLECQELGRSMGVNNTFIDYDCTKAAEKQLNIPATLPLLVQGFKSNGQEDIHYNRFYWAQKIRTVVKTTVFNSESFTGIGFYGNEISYSISRPNDRPGPSGPNIGRFIERSKLIQGADVTLLDGSPAKIVEFVAFVQMSQGGSSGAYGVYLKPFAKFVSGGEEYWNWDSFASNYFINWRHLFDRSADVIR
jgi:hypothetical protein